MKTTVELPDALLEEAKKLAREENTTLRELLQTGLRRVLAERQKADAGSAFRLRDASVGGKGLQPAFDGAGWERIRDAAYGLDTAGS